MDYRVCIVLFPTEVSVLSRSSAKHRKPRRPAVLSQQGVPSRHRHRKPSALGTAVRNRPVQVAGAIAGAGFLVAAISPALTGAPAQPGPLSDLGAAITAGHPASTGRAAVGGGTHPVATGHAAAAALIPIPPESVAHAGTFHGVRPRPAVPAPSHSPRPAAPAISPPVYLNPLRGSAGLLPERVDMGADFAGTGPVYPIGSAVITAATAGNSGWPGGGWITYRLTSGPAAGLMVYVAEDVTPTVQAGQVVTASTVIGNMWAGSAGIETGWAQASTLSAESQLPEAGGISGNGPFPTAVGVSFDELLQALGVPAGSGSTEAPQGILPARYQVDWAAALHR